MDNFNIDILKWDTRAATVDFMNIFYRNLLFSYINTPTRIMETSATLMDKIFTNVLDYSISFNKKWSTTL